MKENESLEFKRSTSELKEAIISISAMLNKHGRAEVYFGIKNDGTIIGQNMTDKTLRDISQSISNHIEPKIFPTVKCKSLDSKDCIHVKAEGEDKPYYAYGHVYMRVGDEDRQLSTREIEQLIIQKSEGKNYWDIQPSVLKADKVDETELADFVKRGKKAGRLEFNYVSKNTTLNKLGLIDNNILLRAGEVLFCTDNPLEVQMAIFAGNDKTTFLDIKQLKGNLFHILRESELYLKSNIRWKVEFGKLEREEIPEIPIKALREALVNSVCHRDYRNPKGNEVAIFKDRIEIYNPGKFPDGLIPDDYIRGEERSVLRNPLIANMLYFSKDIEKWGSGLKRIVEECNLYGVNTEFKPLKTGFLVIFHRKNKLDKGLGDRLGEKLGKKLGENEKKIILLLSKNPYLSMAMIAKEIGISITAVENNIKKLKEKNLLKHIGPAKGGHWEVMESNLNNL